MGHGLARNNHEASRLLIERVFGWSSDQPNSSTRSMSRCLTA
jgi:hypothetical protein